jgi:polysaccharide biosynthesis/export protein
MVSITRWSLVAVLMVFLSACSAGPNNNRSAGTEVPVAGDTTAAVGIEKAKQSDDTQRLAALWEKRLQQRAANDYAIGPGDVLEINVAGVEEMKNISERVTGDETVSLPFVGIINTRGFTDKTLRSEIRRRLETNYVRNPQVSLFVKEFRSRQVAVIGAVQKPGLYNLASSADTVMSMISQAGGMRTDAAEHILFLPAEPAEPEKAKEVIDSLPVQVLSQDPSPLILKNVDPLVINLDSVNRSGNQRYLNMPALPGDIVMVPGGGEVLIQGWVAKPGAYKITSGLTILGAMAAAGGTSYPADTASVELIRTNAQGHKSTFVADLDAIKSGAQPDVPLREGDVIDVVSYGPKLVAYQFYRFFTTVFNVGASANIPIR